MDLDKLIEQKIKDSRLYGVTKPTIIKEILKIPNEIDIKKLDKKIRGVKQKSIIPYLHSAVKQRSYHTNAQTHIGDKYVFAIDLKDFYPYVINLYSSNVKSFS